MATHTAPRRPFRQARSRKAIARRLILECALFLVVIGLVVIALPIYFGADPAPLVLR